jgi:putative membrane protein
MSDMTEIAASKLGQERGNAQQKTFASQMMTDHTKTSEEFKSMAPADAKAATPTTLDSSSQSKIDKLRDAKPDNFSSDFVSMQVSAHKDAVSLFERYAKGGDDPKLKDRAGKTLPALQHHLEMAQDLGKTKVIEWLRGEARRQIASGARASRSGGFAQIAQGVLERTPS